MKSRRRVGHRRHNTGETQYNRLAGKENKVYSSLTTHLHPDRITGVRGMGPGGGWDKDDIMLVKHSTAD